jgi:hypothetical protein
MPTSYKRLGATTVSANTDTELYTVPASTNVIVSSITVCHTGSTSAVFRIAHIDTGGIVAVATEDYIAFDIPIGGNKSTTFNLGLSMGAGETLMVRSDDASVVFNCTGVEITGT